MSTRENVERRLVLARAERYGSALVSLPDIYRAGHAEYNRLRAAGVDVEDIPSRVRGREKIYQHARWLDRKDREAAAAAGRTPAKKPRDTPLSVPKERGSSRHDRRMAAVKGRKHNPGGGGTHAIRGRVAREQYLTLSRMADALGISMSTVLERMIAAQDLDEDGRPTWAHHQQELPVKSA